MEEGFKKKYTPNQALLKIQAYCAYQERSHYEVKEKLYSFGLYKSDVDRILAELVIDNYLNEERFAEAYVSGKLRIKKWGRNKILIGLKAKRVSDYCIKKGLKSIDEEEYNTILQEVFEKRNTKEKEKNPILRKRKIANYMLSRGFESDLVWDLLKEQKGD